LSIVEGVVLHHEDDHVLDRRERIGAGRQVRMPEIVRPPPPAPMGAARPSQRETDTEGPCPAQNGAS
jgi:hypothetical protein